MVVKRLRTLSVDGSVGLMIFRVRLCLARLCLTVLVGGGLAAAESEGWIDDTTRALDSAKIASLEQDLRAFHTETGVRLGIKTVAFLDPGVPMRTAAREARRGISGTGPVAIILVDRGKNGLGISHSPELWQRYPLAELVEVLRAALTQANAEAEAGLETKLLAAAGRWMTDVRRLEQERQQAARFLNESDHSVLLTCLVLFGCGGIGTMVLSARKRLHETSDRQHYEFPNVIVGQRLGAPYGGGHIAEWDSGPPQAG